jgi:hypothetical protein
MQSPLKPAVRNFYADGDTVVVFFDARGTARDGRPYVNTYAWFLDMRGGSSGHRRFSTPSRLTTYGRAWRPDGPVRHVVMP